MWFKHSYTNAEEIVPITHQRISSENLTGETDSTKQSTATNAIHVYSKRATYQSLLIDFLVDFGQTNKHTIYSIVYCLA